MKFPIVIIGTAPRCGSTVLAYTLQKKLNLPIFLEPWSSSGIDKSNESQVLHLQEYLEYRKNNNRYILKFFLHDIEYRSPYYKEIQTGYKIALARKNLIDQVASWYIGDSRKKWRTYKDEVTYDYIVNIDEGNISNYIFRVSRANFFLEHMNFFDARMYYEDLNFQNMPTDFVKTNLPKNIDELKQQISNQLTNHIPFHWTTKQFDFDKEKLFSIKI